jgi:hypothetical protein
MELLTYAPVASLKGFPGNALPGEWLLEALVLAAFAHQVRKDEAFAKEARRFVLEGGYQGSGELVSGLKERLFAARPELADLAVADLPLEGGGKAADLGLGPGAPGGGGRTGRPRSLRACFPWSFPRPLPAWPRRPKASPSP